MLFQRTLTLSANRMGPFTTAKSLADSMKNLNIQRPKHSLNLNKHFHQRWKLMPQVNLLTGLANLSLVNLKIGEIIHQLLSNNLARSTKAQRIFWGLNLAMERKETLIIFRLHSLMKKVKHKITLKVGISLPLMSEAHKMIKPVP